MICIAFLKRDILHAGTFRENESIGLSLRRDFGFVIILQTSTFREMCRELGFVTQTLELNLSQLSCFFSSVVMLTSRGTQMSLVRDLIATIFRLIFFS